MTALDEKALEKARELALELRRRWQASSSMLEDDVRLIAKFAVPAAQSPVGELVKRLRKGAVEPCQGCCYGDTMTEAATALLALQAENERLNECCLALGNEIKELRAESKAEGFVMVPQGGREDEHES